MTETDRLDTFPVQGRDWQGTLQVWRDPDRRARHLRVLLPDGSEIPVDRDEIEEGDDAFHLPLTESELKSRATADAGARLPLKRQSISGDEMPLREQVAVDRIPMNQVVETTPPIRDDGDVIVIPVVQEETVVSKRLVLKEEIHIRRIRKSEPVRESVTLRSERGDVERAEPETTILRKEPGRQRAGTERKYRFLKDW